LQWFIESNLNGIIFRQVTAITIPPELHDIVPCFPHLQTLALGENQMSPNAAAPTTLFGQVKRYCPNIEELVNFYPTPDMIRSKLPLPLINRVTECLVLQIS
jgi:hypothetical protein